MANYSTLKAAVADVVKTNGTQAITGANLQAVLLSIINSVGGGGYIFAGVATPSTSPGTPDQNVFYIGGAGTYANFGTSVTVPVGSIGVFKYNGSWSVNIIDIATEAATNIATGIAKSIVNNFEYAYNQIEQSDNSYQGYYIAPSTGNMNTNSNLTASDFITVSPSTEYVFYNFGKLYAAWYNSSKQYISGITFNGTLPDGTKYTSPANAAYFRLSTDNAYYSSAGMYIVGNVQPSLNPLINVELSENETKKILNYITPNINSFVYLNDTTDKMVGYYIAPSTGNANSNSSYTASTYLSVLSETDYYLYGFGTLYAAWYNSSKQYISGITYNGTLPDGTKYTSPANAAFIRVSTQTTSFQNSIITSPLLYLAEPILVKSTQIDGIDMSAFIKYTTKTVKPSGGGDYTKLSDAFDSITDASFTNRYIVEFYGDGTEYNTLNDKPYVAGEIGLRIPHFTRLVGVGGAEKCILVRRLSSADQNDSLLNLYNTSELDGFTLIANNTRYVVHDDFWNQADANLLSYNRMVKNCIFKAESTYYHIAYGAGTRSGCQWTFENCVFESSTQGTNSGFSCHNNTGFTNPAHLRFVNCRFNDVHNDYAFRLGSINNNANGIVNVVEFYGNKIQKLWLMEEGSGSYGSGILFKVTGYANDLKTGSENITITNTDSHDYSGNIDLI